MSDKPQLETAVLTFYQSDESSTTGDDQTLTIRSDDAGGGKYFVIATERWSFDNLEDLTALFDRLRTLFTAEEWGG